MIFYFPIFQGKISKMPYCFLLSMDLNINWSLVIEKAWLARIWRFLYSVSYSRHTQNILLPNSFFWNFLWYLPEIFKSYCIFPGWREWMVLYKEGGELLVLWGKVVGGFFLFPLPLFFLRAAFIIIIIW